MGLFSAFKADRHDGLALDVYMKSSSSASSDTLVGRVKSESLPTPTPFDAPADVRGM
jgi:hypothetical protein